MSVLGRTFFSRSSFIFWCLAPVILFCIIGMHAIARPISLEAHARIFGIDLLAILVLLCLYDPIKYRFSTRVLTALVFFTYVLYFLDTYFVERMPLAPTSSRAGSNPWNAILGMIFIGLPSLSHTVTGCFVPVERENMLVEDETRDNTV